MEEYQVKKVYQLEELTSPDCIAKIQGMLRKTVGVNAGEVLLDTSSVKVVFDESMISSDQIKSDITKLGFKVLSEK